MTLPFNYEIDEENKVILIHWGQNGQLGRYVVPVVVKENGLIIAERRTPPTTTT